MEVTTYLSNKYTKGRNGQAITRITPHCIVGQISAMDCAKMWERAGRDASANYIIGKDGDIVYNVEEVNTAWTSSSPENDRQAITIECASDPSYPYAFNETVMHTLAELTADIIRRNNRRKLVYIEDKNAALNYKVKDDEMLITFHRWFANKACPGDWFINHCREYVDCVNELLGNSEPQPTPQPTPAPTPNPEPAADVYYKVKTAKGWLPEVKNLNDYAGIENTSIIGLAVKIPNHAVKYRVHLISGKWLPYVTGYNINDFNNGYAGDNKTPIDAIEITSDVPVRYRASVVGSTSYYDWQRQNSKTGGQDGYAGVFGSKIDKVQIYVD